MTGSREHSQMEKWVTAQLKSHAFSPFDPASINALLKNSKLICDTNEILPSAAMWLFYFFTNKSACAVLYIRPNMERIDRSRSRSTIDSTSDFTTYQQVVEFLLKQYATDEATTETESKLRGFVKQSRMTPLQSAEELVSKIFCYGDMLYGD